MKYSIILGSFFLILILAAGGYVAFDRQQKLEREKLIAIEKMHMETEKMRLENERLKIASEEKIRIETEKARIRAEQERRKLELEQLRLQEEQKKAAEQLRHSREVQQQQNNRKKEQLAEKTKELSALQNQLAALRRTILRNDNSKQQKEEKNAQELTRIRTTIQELEHAMPDIREKINTIRRNQKMLICYEHCVTSNYVTCRVQMGKSAIEKTLTGLYQMYCDEQVHRPGSLCRDINGYRFVCFVCRDHKHHWDKFIIARYREMRKHNSDLLPQLKNYQAQYQFCARQLKKQKDRLAQLNEEQEQYAENQPDPMLEQQKELQNKIRKLQQEIKLLQQN